MSQCMIPNDSSGSNKRSSSSNSDDNPANQNHPDYIGQNPFRASDANTGKYLPLMYCHRRKELWGDEPYQKRTLLGCMHYVCLRCHGKMKDPNGLVVCTCGHMHSLEQSTTHPCSLHALLRYFANYKAENPEFVRDHAVAHLKPPPLVVVELEVIDHDAVKASVLSTNA